MVAAVGCGDADGLGAGEPSDSFASGWSSERVVVGVSGGEGRMIAPERAKAQTLPGLQGVGSAPNVDRGTIRSGGIPLEPGYAPRPGQIPGIPNAPIQWGSGGDGCEVIDYD